MHARPTRHRWRTILAIVVIATILAQPVSASTQERYEGDLSSIASLQNGDGGFGAVAWGPSGESEGTAADRDAYLETTLTVHLLLLEGHDALAVHPNWQGIPTSLAASSAPNALDWLRSFEAHHADLLDTGALALGAVALHGLNDEANAQRVLRGLIDDTAAADEVSPADLARIVLAQRTTGMTFENASRNASYAQIVESSRGAVPTSTEEGAWMLLARPAEEALRADLIARLNADPAPPKEVQALAAWALGKGGDEDGAAGRTLAAVQDRSPYGLARVIALHAERTIHPWVSPLVPGQSDSVALDAGASATMGDLGRVVPPERPTVEGPTGPDQADDVASIPVPTWLMTIIILAALAILGVVSLAYGLKKESLTGPRKNIFAYIDKHPGEHFSKIRRELGLAPGTFQHHLSVLEAEGWITSYKDARYKRYFVNGNRYQTLIKGRTTQEYKSKFSALKNETSKNFVQFVQANPGVSQKQVAQRFELHPSTVNWHAKRLQQAGILDTERVGKEVRYRVDTDTVDKLLKK